MHNDTMDCRRGVLLVLLDLSKGQITECVEDLRRWLTDNRLLLNKDKTEAILFRSSVPVTSTINIGRSVAQLKPTVHDIGVVLDTRLDMASQVLSVCRSTYYHLFRIAKQSITFQASDRSLPLALIHILASELLLASIHEIAR